MQKTCRSYMKCKLSSIVYIILGLLFSLPVTVNAAIDVPEWSYGAISALAKDGYVQLKGADIHSLSRQQMAGLTIQAMKYMEHSSDMPGKSSEVANHVAAYAQLSGQDAAQFQMLKDKEIQLSARYAHLLSSIKSNSEKLTYGSMQSSDNLALLRSINAKQIQDETELADVAVRLRSVRTKLIQYQYIMDAWKDKEASLMMQTVSQAKVISQAAPTDPAMQTVAKLRVEFAPELASAGYYDDQAAVNVAVIQTPPKPVDLDKRLKIDGEVRYDFRHNSSDRIEATGKRKYPDDLHRLRERLYMDYDIDGNWHLMGMLESEKALKGDGKDGQIHLDRYYVQGHMGKALVTAGAFGSLMAEGNVYDSKFKGAMVDFGDAVKYKLSAGSIDQANDVYTATASYTNDNYTVEAGAYRFNKLNGDDNHRTILMGNFRRPLGNYDFGLMFLHGIDGNVGNGNGFVATLSHGKYNSWLKGNSMWYVKYYRQPESTYVEHTMNGMADWMKGFKGIGLGYSYTLRKNLVLNLEYDMLKDLTEGDSNNTFWLGLSWFFSNYGND